MHVLSVVGARPQFVKLAPVAEALRDASIRHTVVHTGQHYDFDMSEALFRDFQLAEPSVNLGVGSGSHAEMTGSMLRLIEPVLQEISPDIVLVYGDTDSTLAATLASVKLRIPVAHLEAGLRSWNRAMPEEHNRVLTDHAADLLLAPTRRAMDNLAVEGLSARSKWTGDVMVDVCLRTAAAVAESRSRNELPAGDYALATLHRPVNTDDPERLRRIVNALREFPVPVLFPVHPRLRDRSVAAGATLDSGALHPVSPMNYSAMIHAVLNANAVVTDSGGLQKEAYVLGKTCTTIRTETEWPETLNDDWNVLVRDDCVSDLVSIALRSQPQEERRNAFGDGHAAESVTRALMQWSLS